MAIFDQAREEHTAHRHLEVWSRLEKLHEELNWFPNRTDKSDENLVRSAKVELYIMPMTFRRSGTDLSMK